MSFLPPSGPNPGADPGSESSLHSRRHSPHRKTILGLSGILLIAGTVLWQGWVYLHDRLTPLIEQNLSQALDRPVKLGKVEAISLTGLKFGQSIIPPTPDNYTWITIEDIQIDFNLWTLLVERKLDLRLGLEKPRVHLSQDPRRGWAAFSFQTEESTGAIHTDIDQLRVQDGMVFLHPLNLTDRQGDRRSLFVIHHIEGQTTFHEGTQRADLQLVGRIAEKGRFRLTGEATADGASARIALQGQELPLDSFNALLPPDLTLTAGVGAIDLELQHHPNQPLSVTGSAQVQQGSIKLATAPLFIHQFNSQLRFAGEQIRVEDTKFRVGAIPITLQGRVHLKQGLDLTAQVLPTSVQAIPTTLGTTMPIPLQGDFQATARITGSLSHPQIAAQVSNAQPVTIDRLRFSTLSARLTATSEQILLQNMQARLTSGGSIVGRGSFNLAGSNQLAFTAQGNVPIDSIAQLYNLTVPTQTTLGSVAVNAQVNGTLLQPEAIAQWQLAQGTYPGRGKVEFSAGVLRLVDTQVRVGEGQLTGSAIARLAEGRWQATIASSQIATDRLVMPVNALLNGTVDLAGSLHDFSPRAVQARGTIQLAEGLAEGLAEEKEKKQAIPEPLTAAFQWSGNQLNIQQMTAPGLEAQGTLAAQSDRWDRFAFTNLDLSVRMRQYDLSTARAFLPSPEVVEVAGRANFEGRITGTLTNPTVAGQLGLHHFAVNDLVFEPVLNGALQFAPQQGLNVDLRGNRDRIALVLDQRYRPNQVLIQADRALLAGKMTGNQLTAQVEQFPLEVLRFAPAAAFGIGDLSGKLSGQMVADLTDLNRPQAVGNLAIDRPALGHLNAAPDPRHGSDRFVTSFRYRDDTLTLTNSALTLGSSLYRLNGSFIAGQNPQFAGQLVVDRGEVQDLLVALQWFDRSDIGRLRPPLWSARLGAQASQIQALAPLPGSRSSSALQNQLQRFSEITAQVSQPLQAEPPSDLSEVQGHFSGQLTVQGSAQTGVVGTMDIQGQDWRWGTEGIEQVSLRGALAGSKLTVDSATMQGLVIKSANGSPQRFDTMLTLAGEATIDQFSGSLQINHAPLAVLHRFVAFPTEVEGTLNATATLYGNLNNPEIQGEFMVGKGQVGGVDLEDIRGVFAYADARLRLDSELVTTEPGHLIGRASIPYKLPFATVSPASDAIDVDLNIRNEGLSLLNRFTGRQLTWESGNAEVDVQIAGTLQSPQIQGTGSFDHASFSSAALSSPITDLSGQILLSGDRLTIPALQGEFGGGALRAQGALPLFNTSTSMPSLSAVLTLMLDDVTVNLQGSYRGKVNGEVLVLGNVFAPVLTGELRLSDGRLLLQSSAPPPDFPLQFEELRLTLGERFRLITPPILAVRAAGNVDFSGSLTNPRPAGTVRLLNGRVNLFGSRFHLSSTHENTARFIPARGFDPLLDVQLTAYIPEVERRWVRYSPEFSPAEIEVAEPTIPGSERVQSLLVEARFQDPVSALISNPNTVILRSVPPRTRSEILQSLGGGITTAFLDEEGVLLLENLADAALLTNAELWLEDILHLEEFNVFPVGMIEDGQVQSQELAFEASKNITNDLTISVLNVVTLQEPVELILRYRLNNNIRFRGFTNLGNDTGILIQFNTEF